MRAPLSYWIFRAGSSIRWYLSAKTRYDVHSPHLVEFIREVFRDDREYHAFEKIATIRRYWRSRRETVQLVEQGAKSKTTSRQRRTAASLVASNAIGPQSGKFLFRLALWLRAERILEFGTNAGISTLYLTEADPRAEVYTVEGNAEVAVLAHETFEIAGVAPKSHLDLFGTYLKKHPPTQDSPFDLVFIDGDHRYQATLDYVTTLLPARSEDTVIVVADIHWSEGMERAWKEITELPGVTASVDTYHFGLLFFKTELNGPHVSLISTRYKPWRLGFFS